MKSLKLFIKRQIAVFLCILIAMCSFSTVGFATSKSQADALNWVKSQVGNGLDYDGAYGCQCVDLIKYYYSYLGVSAVSGNGCDYAWNSLPSGWSRVQGGTPQPGDILVYSGNDSNPYGHVAIYESDRSHYHQNFSGHPYVEKVTYMYNGLSNPYWGYIRPNWGSGGSSSSSYFQSVSASNITQNDAKIEASIIGTNISTCGFYFGTVIDYADNTMTKTTETVNGYVEKIFYTLSADYGQLKPGVTYYYAFFITINGVEYRSEFESFVTEKAIYTVTYDANGGTVSPSKATVKQGTKTTLPTPVKSYTITYNANGGTNAPPAQKVSVPCRGWATTKNATSGIKLCGSSYYPESDVTLYAIWRQITGAFLADSVPERQGYTFLGWSKSSTAASASYGAGYASDIVESTTLYAVWEKQTTNYTVTYNANGGTVSPSNATVEQGNTITLPTPVKSYTITYNANGGVNAPAVQKTNVSCKGWSVSSTATNATYSCGATFKPQSDVTLYAVWNTSASAILSSAKPTREGYVFKGWSENSSAINASFTSGSSVNVSGDAVLYAIWEKIATPTPSYTEQNLSMNYKDTIYVNGAVSVETSNPGVASVSNGKIVASGTGTADVTATFTDGSKCVYHINVSYTWWQWIIVIVLFGWIWY